MSTMLTAGPGEEAGPCAPAPNAHNATNEKPTAIHAISRFTVDGRVRVCLLLVLPVKVL